MSENKRNFLVHGGILAMAGILVRIIGMFYRIPLVNIIGSDGNGIYGAAYNVYNIMLVLSAYGRSEERRVGKECRSRWSPYH